MTRIILGLILVAISLQSHGQIIVTGFEAKPMDLTASTHMRRDFNEQPCALVKVGLRAKDASFEGNIIGDTEMHTNEYWVYMTGGSKMLNIKHISAPSLLVRFSDYGVVALEPKMTYVLDLELPQPVAEQQVMQKVIINFSPSSAVVLLDGQMLDTNNGVATTSLPAGKDYSYTVAAKGYESSEGNFRLKATAPARLNIQLYPLETASVSQPAQSAPAQQEVPDHAFNSQGGPAVATETEEEIIKKADKAFAEKLYDVAMDNYLKIQNNAYAQMKIGHMYTNELGVKKDYEEALRWYQKSAAQGYSGGQLSIGFAYELGRGVKRDYKEALSWYEKAAQQKDAFAINSLGYMYEMGRGVDKDVNKALLKYKESANLGNGLAQNNLGWIYKDSKAPIKDYEKAVHYFRLSAENGCALGCCGLGLIVSQGKGTKKDKEEANKWNEIARAKGIIWAGKPGISYSVTRAHKLYRELEWLDFIMK